MRDISDSAVRKTVEENQDLRRQVLIHIPTVYTITISILFLVIFIHNFLLPGGFHIFVTINENVVSQVVFLTGFPSQVVFLQQTVDERDRRIRALESLLVRLELRVLSV